MSEFHTYEESLKAFLIEAQTDNYTSRNANFYKYNNLKIYMDVKKSKIPHFIIRIGISESMYSLESANLLSGGLGVDERPVRRWLDRNFSRMDLGRIWKVASRVKQVVMRHSEDDEE